MFLIQYTVVATVLLCFFSNPALAERAGKIIPDPDPDTVGSVILGSCPNCTEIRLSEGCSGILEVLSKNHGYAMATDLYFGANEALVVCRQLGCGTNKGTERTFTSESRNNVYQGFGYRCNGDEQSLSDCSQRGAYISTDDGIAITCAREAAEKA